MPIASVFFETGIGPAKVKVSFIFLSVHVEGDPHWLQNKSDVFRQNVPREISSFQPAVLCTAYISVCMLCVQ